MREQRTKAQVKKKQKQKLQDNNYPLSPLPHAVINQLMSEKEGKYPIIIANTDGSDKKGMH